MIDRHRPAGADFADLAAAVTACDRCPRLTAYRRSVEPRPAYANQTYWNRPVPGFGDPAARLWVVGLAPGAHGANRTGRVFTGDRSGDFLYAALHRAGYANQPASTARDDGLTLTDCYVSGAARCAPPGNRPTPAEVAACGSFLDREWQLLAGLRTILALGGIAWSATLAMIKRQGLTVARTPFGHGVELPLRPGLTLVGSYHVSQQNTFTGRLTPAMFDAVLVRCRALSDGING